MPEELNELKLDEFEEELDDFDLEENKIVYEVWALGYDENDQAVDVAICVDCGYTDVKEAEKCFDFFSDEDKFRANFGDQIGNAAHLTLVLEECIDTGDIVECQAVLKEFALF